MYQALVIDKDEAGYRASIKALDEDNLPEGDVTVRVDYSTINYKDGLAITGKSPVVRKFPLVAGIDFAGTVESSSHAAWKAGDKVVLNGWGVGETHSGGLAQRARVRGDWLVALPAGLTHAPGHGHRHRGLHRDAVRDGAARPWPQAGQRRHPGHRCQRRRRQRGHRLAVEARLSRRRLHRPRRTRPRR